jgi:hypothetical protein
MCPATACDSTTEVRAFCLQRMMLMNEQQGATLISLCSTDEQILAVPSELFSMLFR